MQNSLLNRRAMISGAIGMAALGSADIARSRGQTSAATPAAGGIPPGTMPIKPFALSEMRLTRIIASTRPFRNAGPRLEAESINDKTIVHSYGHGGCGWSLSWGAAEEAAALALSSAPSSVAVIGAGAIGLTTATVLRRAGVATTIYAQELPTESRSAGATGTWSADSRIAKTANASPQLADRIERLARRSYVAHQQY
ncbi:MAG: FAD-dependent oxidoreductase, partial [Novosphingobium sp.]